MCNSPDFQEAENFLKGDSTILLTPVNRVPQTTFSTTLGILRPARSLPLMYVK